MKLKLLLIGLALSVATVVAATKPAAAQEKAAPTVKDTQVNAMELVANGILEAAKSVSGPQSVFSVINGNEQIGAIERETPLSGAVRSAKGVGEIICYQDGVVVAATDPTLIGKKAEDFKTSDGRTVLGLVVNALKASKDDKTVVTYEARSSDVLVNGKLTSHGRVVYAIGRNSIAYSDKSANSKEKKYVITINSDINL